jgi:hypothetical protein
MKHLLLVLLAGFVVFGYANADIYGYFWTRYTYENPTTPEVDENANYFSIERGYVRWKTSTKPVSVAATVDISMKRKATNASDWNVRLKYAQANWTLPGISNSLPDFQAIIGLQKTYFGVIDKWEYHIIEKSLEDAEKKINSAELGLTFWGYLPNGFGTIAASAYNGNGYAEAVEDNLWKDLSFDLSVIPLPGVMVKGSAWLGKKNAVIDTVGTTEEVAKNRYAGVLQIMRGPLTVMGEYLYCMDGVYNADDIVSWGAMGYVEYAVSGDVSLLGRYDYFDPNNDVENNAHSRIIGGINWKVSESLLWQNNYQIEMYEDDARDAEDKFMVQFVYSF